MSLHRILLGRSKNLFLSKAIHSPIRNFSDFPLGREPSSLPPGLTMKLDPNSTPYSDDRPISLRFRVSSMIELSQLDKAAQISRHAVLDEYIDLPYTVPLICNQIIGAMYGAKRYDDAIALFHYFFNKSSLRPDIFTYNLIMKVHCDENNVDDAFELYYYAKTLAVPDIETHMVLVKGFLKAGRIFDALAFVKTEKNLWDSEVYSYLVRGFLDLGNHDKAYEIFDELDHKIVHHHSEDYNRRRAVVEATFVDYWFEQGKDEKAMEIYSSITKKDELLLLYTNTGNALLKVLFGNGKKREAWELFERMITNSKTFDRETFKIMVKECFELKEFEKAVETFKRPELKRSSQCYGEIISRFCALGMMSEAHGLFEEVWSDEYLCPDVPTFRSMINGYAKVGKVDDAKEMLKKMVDATLLKVAVTEAE